MSIALVTSQMSVSSAGTTILLPNTTDVVFAISGIDVTLAQVVPTTAGLVLLVGALQSFNSVGSLTTNFCQFRYSNNGAASTPLVSSKLISTSVSDFIMLPRNGNIQFDITTLSNTGTCVLAINLYGLALP